MDIAIWIFALTRAVWISRALPVSARLKNAYRASSRIFLSSGIIDCRNLAAAIKRRALKCPKLRYLGARFVNWRTYKSRNYSASKVSRFSQFSAIFTGNVNLSGRYIRRVRPRLLCNHDKTDVPVSCIARCNTQEYALQNRWNIVRILRNLKSWRGLIRRAFRAAKLTSDVSKRSFTVRNTGKGGPRVIN